MWIKVKIKSEKNNTPYRVFINDELMTERFYTIAPRTVSNNLVVELEDSPAYDVRVESLTDTLVLLSDYSVKEKLNEN